MPEMTIEASYPRPTDTGTDRGIDVDWTLALPRTEEKWWAWHDEDAARWSDGEDEFDATADAEHRCAAWVAGESDDGPEPVTIEGEVTLLPRPDGDGYGAWGEPAHWISGDALCQLMRLPLDEFHCALRAIEQACATAIEEEM